MTEESARAAIIAYLQTSLAGSSYSAMEVFHDNHRRLPDLNTQTAAFVDASVNLVKSEQMNIAKTPETRHTGLLEIAYYEKEGSGRKTRNDFINFLRTKFDYKTVSGILFRVAQTPRPRGAVGWVRSVFSAPFQFDTTT